MLSRCNNKNNYSYHNYGGRGIKVCKRWYIFENFLADMGDKPDGLSLDRRNNSGNYTKQNCRWATQDEQSFNRRNNRYLKFGSETLTVTEWSRRTGLSYDKILYRFHNKKGLT
jgi:hypothetical protein